jgi:hypothetical protein
MNDDKVSFEVATDCTVERRFIDIFSRHSCESWTGREGFLKLWVLFEDAVDSLAKLVGVLSLQIEGSLRVEISVKGDSFLQGCPARLGN